MPLIPCPDCEREISNRAPSCPHCGCPIASQAKGRAESDRVSARTVTTQGTGKGLKVLVLVGWLLMLTGIVFGGLVLGSADGSDDFLVPLAMFVVGFVIYLVGRIRTWYEHA